MKTPHSNIEILEILNKYPEKRLFAIRIPLFPVEDGFSMNVIRAREELELRLGLITRSLN